MSIKTRARAIVDEEAERIKLYKQKKHSKQVEEVLEELDEEELDVEVLDYVKKHLK